MFSRIRYLKKKDEIRIKNSSRINIIITSRRAMVIIGIVVETEIKVAIRKEVLVKTKYKKTLVA